MIKNSEKLDYLGKILISLLIRVRHDQQSSKARKYLIIENRFLSGHFEPKCLLNKAEEHRIVFNDATRNGGSLTCLFTV